MSTPGHWDGLYHRETGCLLIKYYDIDLHIMGLINMYALTNDYIPAQRHYDVVPVYEDYRVLFDKCDNFNKHLCHCTWPHKCVRRPW